MKPLLLGICAAFCFSFTYLFNRSMGINGGYWQWTACLRYLYMFPIMLPIIYYRKSAKRLWGIVRQSPGQWLIWSFVAYVVFNIPLSIGSTYSPAWLTAATWEITLIAGILMSPLFYHVVETPQGPKRVRHKVPWRSLLLSGIIIIGVVIVQLDQAAAFGWREMALAALPTVIAAIAYPLGNRKTMTLAAGRMDAFERIFVLDVLTLPFWLCFSAFNVATIGWPSADQLVKCFGASFIASVMGTMLFFKAMEMVSGDMQKLAGVEATQSTEIIFTVLVGMVFLQESLTSVRALLGIGLIVAGNIFYSRLIAQPEHQKKVKRKAHHVA